MPALEKAAEGLKCTTAVHICYGYGIEANIKWKETLGESWRQYEETFPALDRSSIQQVSLECRESHVPPELMKLLKTKTVLVGAIDVASNEIETPEQVAETLKLAATFVDPERIQACTNCGMAPMTLGVAYGKLPRPPRKAPRWRVRRSNVVATARDARATAPHHCRRASRGPLTAANQRSLATLGMVGAGSTACASLTSENLANDLNPAGAHVARREEIERLARGEFVGVDIGQRLLDFGLFRLRRAARGTRGSGSEQRQVVGQPVTAPDCSPFQHRQHFLGS